MAGKILNGVTTAASFVSDNAPHCAVPSGAVPGDIYLLTFEISVGFTLTWPSGFTEFDTHASEGTIGGDLRTAWRRYDGTESGTFTASTGASYDTWHGNCCIAHGVLGIIDNASAAAYAGFATAIPCLGAAVTTGETNRLIVTIQSCANALNTHTLTMTQPSGFTVPTGGAVDSTKGLGIGVSYANEPLSTTAAYNGSFTANSADTFAGYNNTIVFDVPNTELNLRSVAAYSTIVGAGAITPAMPTGWAVGDLLLLHTGVYSGSTTLATPAGWTRLSIDGTDKQCPLFGRIAQLGDTAPAINWGGTSYAGMACFTGVTFQDLSTIVHIHNSRGSTNTSSVPYPSLNVTIDDNLILTGGRRFKTSATDGATFNITPTNFFKMGQSIPAGNFRSAAVWNFQIQKAATALVQDGSVLSISDASDASNGFAVALLIAAASSPTPVINVPRLMGGFRNLNGNV